MIQTDSPYQDKIASGSSHLLIKAALEDLPNSTRILDIGIGTGIAPRLNGQKDFSFWGVEPNPEWAEAAKGIYKDIFIGTLEEIPDTFLSDFNAVLLMDILEHTSNPQESLQRLVNSQNKGTLFFISVPNIANIWIRINLLFGKFNYTENGILDRTHLKFFTRKTLLAMLDAAGLTVLDITPTPIPLGLVKPVFNEGKVGYPIYLFLLWITKLFPTLFGYQFFCRTIKQGE